MLIDKKISNFEYMRIPKFLKPGDKIGLICTARGFTEEDLKPTLSLIQSWGYEAVIGNSVGKFDNQYGGTDKERANDLQIMINNPSIRAIWICRGGYGTIRLVDKIDFSGLMNDPKWIIGYSDVTILHNYLNQFLGIASIHATMPINISTNSKESLESLKSIISGQKTSFAFEKKETNLRFEKSIKGKLIGGNLSILYSLLGTKSGFDTHNKILFIEDVGEYLYHIDRMMISLKNANKLSTIKALLVGGMTDMNDNTVPFGKTPEQIISEHCHEYNFPVIFGVPSGHFEDNRALLLGEDCSVECENNSIKITFGVNI
jgi:muramoyltetrapeptide carboxypeptidase